MILMSLAAIVIGSASITLTNATALLELIDLIRSVERARNGDEP